MNIDVIWAEYRVSLKAFLHSRISEAADVDDLFQDILLKTHQNLDSIKSESSVKSWLFQIANNAVIDFYRKKGKSNVLNKDDLWYGDSPIEIEQSLSQCIAPFIKALPKDSAELLTEIELNGQSQKAYAEALGLPYSTLKSRVQKSRHQLRSLFEKCCHLTLDKQGNLVDCAPKLGSDCKTC